MTRILIFLSAPMLLYVYLGLRLSPGWGGPAWFALAMLVGVILIYPLSWRRGKGPSTAPSTFRWLIYLDMGLLSFLGSFVILRDILFLPLQWFRPDLTSWIFGPAGSLSVVGLSLVSLAFGVWQAWSGPRVRTVGVPIKDLPAALEGFKIAQISDLHVGPTIGSGYVDRVVELVNSLQPDLTVLTGDIADGHADDLQEAIAPLGKLQNAARTMYVTGNHEYYWNGPRWVREFEALGMRALMNTCETLKHAGHDILIAGVIDPAARVFHPDLKPDARAAGGVPGTEAIRILLSHHPGIAREAAEAGFHLQLSGHTHAGQFFPWTLLVDRVHEFSKGLKACGKMWVYVNPGTGSWGPPVRFGSMSEITLVELVRDRTV